MTEAQNDCNIKSNQAKRSYSRKEMEVLRFTNLGAQQKKWIEVYCGLAPTVAEEYDSLLSCKHHKSSCFDFDPRQQFQNKETASGALGVDCTRVRNYKIENMDSLHVAAGLSGKDDGVVAEEDCDEEDESDDDYISIQRPAFLVSGEPNFDSGPPQDGLEYLRRVRWEAARIPRVKVAKLEKSRLNREQTVYMPQIPDIAKCPEHLLPLKHWENAFIHEFSELRKAFSRLDSSGANVSAHFQVLSLVDEEEESFNQHSEDFDKVSIENESSEAFNGSMPENSSAPRSDSEIDEDSVSLSFEKSRPNCCVRGSLGNGPTLSAILKMDSVARLSMLRKKIGLVESMRSLSRNESSWLFALCAVIDTPLDADTCAALRSLLRKCASLRAEKSEMDDEFVMLNIIATIAGKYFGQSEC